MQIKQEVWSSLESIGDILAGCIFFGIVSVYVVIKVKGIEMSHPKSEFMKEKRAQERVLESSSI